MVESNEPTDFDIWDFIAKDGGPKSGFLNFQEIACPFNVIIVLLDAVLILPPKA